jgi:regulator of protease activity HflC (stomatin/prohibitin superfamily)
MHSVIARRDLLMNVAKTSPFCSRSRFLVKVVGSHTVYFRVVDAERAIIQVSNYLAATSQLAQTTLRWVLGKHDLDQMLAERDKLNDIQDVLDKQTEGWGFKVSTVELKRIDLDESMIRAIARQAEAEEQREPLFRTDNPHGDTHPTRARLDRLRRTKARARWCRCRGWRAQRCAIAGSHVPRTI